MRRLFGSVRSRATLAATLVVAVALVAAGAAVLLSLRSNLMGQAGTQAEHTARSIATELSLRKTIGQLDLDEDEEPVQVVDGNGRLLAVTMDLERISGTATDAVKRQPAKPVATGDQGDEDSDDDSDAAEPVEPGDIDDRTTFTNGSATMDHESADYRFAAVQVETEKAGTLTVYAGAPLSAEQGAVRTALTVMLIGFPLLLAVVAAVTWLVTRRALHPVEGIRGEMAAITASADLARRVPVPDTHDEVARLARTTNETLAALESSVERQRRFVADASHELRSPIASLRTQLEVGAAHPELLDVTGAVEDTVRLQRHRPVAARPAGRGGTARGRRAVRPGRAGAGGGRGARGRDGSGAGGRGAGGGVAGAGGAAADQPAGQRGAARPLGRPGERAARGGVGPGRGRRRRRRGAGGRPGADLRAVRTARRRPQPRRRRRRARSRHRPGRRRPARRHPHGP